MIDQEGPQGILFLIWGSPCLLNLMNAPPLPLKVYSPHACFRTANRQRIWSASKP